MNNTIKAIAILAILLTTTTNAQAGIFTKFRNWANTGWNNYGYNSPHHGCPHHHGNSFFNNGAVTGFTPPITTAPGFYYPSTGSFQNPINMNNRFNHLPYGMPTVNTPTRMITDFNSNVGTRTGVTILD